MALVSRRAMLTAALAGGPAIAVAALAAARADETPELPFAALWSLAGLAALALLAHLARYLRGAGINRLHVFSVYGKLATYVAIALLTAGWTLCALTGLSAAELLLRALVFALVGGVVGGMATTALANLLSAIRGPARER